MTTLVARVFSGADQSGTARVVREIKTADGTGDMDTARYQDVSTNYSFSVDADGRLVVSHAIVDGIDGTDKLSNIERLQFTDGSYAIIMGTPFNDNGGSGANDRPSSTAPPTTRSSSALPAATSSTATAATM